MLKSIKKHSFILFILGISICFIFLNVATNQLVRNLHLDMTDAQRYSLSQYSKEQAQNISSPLYITIFYSSEISKINSNYAKYAEFVIRFLQQYQRQNPDKIFIAVKNPIPYSATEKEAYSYGITPFLLSGSQTNFYFGAVFIDSDNKKHIIANFSDSRSFWLEKDITTIFRRFNETERNVIGLISPVHKMIRHDYIKTAENYAFIQELSSRFDIIELATNVERIPNNIKTLLVVTPTKMPKPLSVALEQYVLRGGKLIMLLDGLIEEPYYKTTLETTTHINSLLNNWGLSISEGLLGSLDYGQKIFVGEGYERRLASYPLWIDLPQSAINQTPYFAQGLKNISLRSPSEVSAIEHDEKIKLTPLLSIDDGHIYPFSSYSSNKNDIIKQYKSDNKYHHIAYLSEGFYQSKSPTKELSSDYLLYSLKPSRVVVIGDSDFIRDEVWLQEDKLNDNGQFLLRIIEDFNNQQSMIDLYHSQSGVFSETLGNRLYKQIYARYSSKIIKLQNNLQDLQHELEATLQEIRIGSRMIDASLSLRINEIRSQIKDIENQLVHFDYSIKNSFNGKVQSIIFINLIAIPLVILIIWFLLYKLYDTKAQKQVENKYYVNR